MEAKMKSVLIVEDDPQMAASIARVLRDEFEPLPESDGHGALRTANDRQPDVILLDLTLPDTDGISLCEKLRRNPRTRGIPIIMITGRDDVRMRVRGLEAGADDYLCKPFYMEELLARVRARLRRNERERQESETRRFGNLLLDPRSGEFRVDGEPITLTASEFRILQYFIERPETLLNRDRILADLWPDTIVTRRTIDTHVARLRRKLAGFAGELVTVHRIGYKLTLGPGPRDGAHQ
jgi:DNA-binding response OmpR family regulator